MLLITYGRSLTVTTKHPKNSVTTKATPVSVGRPLTKDFFCGNNVTCRDSSSLLGTAIPIASRKKKEAYILANSDFTNLIMHC